MISESELETFVILENGLLRRGGCNQRFDFGWCEIKVTPYRPILFFLCMFMGQGPFLKAPDNYQAH